MSELDRERFAEIALSLALKAGDEIMAIYNTDFDVEEKDDKSPVTEADRVAEALILQGLESEFPALPIVAEEEAAAGRIPEIGDCFVLVDPLDGTREFLSRNGAFTVNIALVENGVPVAGIVHAPALKRTFSASLGSGAFEIANDESRLITTRTPKAGRLTAVASRSHMDEKTARFLEESGVNETVSIGSSLKFCLVAAGEADLYPRYGRTMEWDTAAGHAVLLAAGGSVTTDTGSPFLYGKRNQENDVD
ncbi:MAG: 3'(2'),5'-bisphosphate nucleotidase CysQ, partial [Pseudomonadota bacterium]